MMQGFLSVVAWICQSSPMYFSPFAKQSQAELWPRFQSLLKLLLWIEGVEWAKVLNDALGSVVPLVGCLYFVLSLVVYWVSWYCAVWRLPWNKSGAIKWVGVGFCDAGNIAGSMLASVGEHRGGGSPPVIGDGWDFEWEQIRGQLLKNTASKMLTSPKIPLLGDSIIECHIWGEWH